MNRTPPVEVRRILSREVGRGCPVPNCGSPYLEWHHFDPPWRVQNHHEPNGMIALCSEHHPKADAGAFTKEQLHNFKANGANNREYVKGKFHWLRNKLLLIAGGFYYETLTILQFRGMPIIWFRRDDDGYLLLNFRMLTTSQEPRLWLEDNGWIERGTPTDFECPPSGKLIHAKYLNGDEIRIEFFELASEIEAQKRYPGVSFQQWNDILMRFYKEHRGGVQFPITAVEIIYNVPELGISLSPQKTVLFGGITMNNAFSAYNDVAISLT